ncbi:MAG: SAM-dependent methyltransferase [Thermoleophilaceae bacterium]|nr:SAM-dependent methyltransferase [Thermoleophilaceae bacterium]
MALGDAGTSRLARSTAEGACALRAAGRTLRPPLPRNPDHLASSFIAPGLKATALVKLPILRGLSPRVFERILPGAIWFELARTIHMDRVLREEVAAGATQAVLLGAGLDSRFYRLDFGAAKLFEVDHPVTGAIKDERLEALFGGRPEEVTYVRIDFNTEDLAQRLGAHGFDPAARTAILWSGVTPYLEPRGVEETLRWFAAGTGPGSSICFDYIFREVIEGDVSSYGARELVERVTKGGEPFRFGIPEGAAEEFVKSFGLELEEDLGPDDAEYEILEGHGRPYGFGGLALVRQPL